MYSIAVVDRPNKPINQPACRQVNHKPKKYNYEEINFTLHTANAKP
jgi:hypothetical protein